MPEEMLLSMLQGHFSSSHCSGTSVSVPTPQGETEALGWDNLLMVTHAKSWKSDGKWDCWEQQAARRAGHNTEASIIIPLCDQRTLGCDGRGTQGKHHRLVTLALSQESTLLKITFWHFRSNRTEKSSCIRTPKTQLGHNPPLLNSLAESRGPRGSQLQNWSPPQNREKQNVISQAGFLPYFVFNLSNQSFGLGFFCLVGGGWFFCLFL